VRMPPSISQNVPSTGASKSATVDCEVR
jgi:hypothetical protein